jgi:DNA ligase (NAD+)
MNDKLEAYQKLIAEIQHHDQLYYLYAKPTISDFAYDQLMKQLEAIEKAHPEWILPSSPTQRVGEMLSKGFKQVPHHHPMLSLANTYSKKEVQDFIKRVYKLLGQSQIDFCAELKLDGVAITAVYENGIFVQGLTRGDGKKGDDITANLKAIRTVPLALTGSSLPERLEIRGEVFINRKVFQQLNREKEQAGEELWANPRNAAAGSLKLLDPRLVAKRHLSVVFYGFGNEKSAPVKTQYATHQYLKEVGLPVFDNEYREHCVSIHEMMLFADRIERKRHELPFEIDGVVIKVDQLHYHDEMGATGRSPRWAVAYKFPPEQGKTRIQEITVQIGRTGVLTPVAELEPISVGGSTISRATLHNQEEIERKDIRIGDWVVIEKGGDVIPKIVSVDHEKRCKDSHPWKMPERCPSCGALLIQNQEEVAIRCPNTKQCPEQQMRQIIFFASKDAMDIDHLGERVIEQLFKKEMIKSASDIYQLTDKDLAQLEGFKEKSIHNLLESIDRSRHVSLARLILALGIKYVGEGTAEALAEHEQDIYALAKMSAEQLLKIEGIGKKIAWSIADYFSDPEHIKQIETLFKLGVTIEKLKISRRNDHFFSGKSFVLTGVMQNYSRTEAAELIKQRGGRVTNAISNKTDFLIVGEDPGSKIDKAIAFNVRIMSEYEFEKTL